jgi:hypothetical protein
MDIICPLCNGLSELSEHCPQCGEKLEDGGQVEGYYNPYFPYEDDLLVPAPNAEENPQQWCRHLVYCRKCKWQGTWSVAQRKGP